MNWNINSQEGIFFIPSFLFIMEVQDICYAQTCKNQTAHQHKTKRGSIWLIGCLTQNLANKLDFYYSFSENGCNYYSRCLKDNNHREFVIVDDYEVSWLDQRNK